MTKAAITEYLHRSQARYKVLLKQRDQKMKQHDQKIRDLQREIRAIKSDVTKFGEIVKRYPRTAAGETDQ